MDVDGSKKQEKDPEQDRSLDTAPDFGSAQQGQLPTEADGQAPNDPNNDFAYHEDSETSPPVINPDDVPEITWTASEYIRHDKGVLWYAGLIGITSVLALLVYLWTRDIISLVAVFILSILFGVSAGHKPRSLDYHLDRQGITIDNHFYHYSEFKSFGVLQEGAFSSIVFMPMKRFRPPLTIYYPPEQQEPIAYVLSNYLPFAPVKQDVIDRLLRQIRF